MGHLVHGVFVINTGKISLFEYSDRIGGRIYTKELPNGMHVEMGAMRFRPDKHHLLVKVLKETNTSTEPFPGIHLPSEGVYFIRGTRKRANESLTPSSFPGYNVLLEERNKTSRQLIE